MSRLALLTALVGLASAHAGAGERPQRLQMPSDGGVLRSVCEATRPVFAASEKSTFEAFGGALAVDPSILQRGLYESELADALRVAIGSKSHAAECLADLVGRNGHEWAVLPGFQCEAHGPPEFNVWPADRFECGREDRTAEMRPGCSYQVSFSFPGYCLDGTVALVVLRTSVPKEWPGGGIEDEYDEEPRTCFEGGVPIAARWFVAVLRKREVGWRTSQVLPLVD